jgi:hypothetical protein
MKIQISQQLVAFRCVRRLRFCNLLYIYSNYEAGLSFTRNHLVALITDLEHYVKAPACRSRPSPKKNTKYLYIIETRKTLQESHFNTNTDQLLDPQLPRQYISPIKALDLHHGQYVSLTKDVCLYPWLY